MEASMKKIVMIIVVIFFTVVMLAEETTNLRLCMVVEEGGSYIPACMKPATMDQLMVTCREGAYAYLRKEIHAPVYVVDEKGKIRWFCR